MNIAEQTGNTGSPAVTIASYASLGNGTGPFVYEPKTYQPMANLSFNKGKHNIRFGGELRYVGINSDGPLGADGGTRGSYSYTDGSWTSEQGVPNIGFGAALGRSPAEIVGPDDLRERDQWVLWRYEERDGKATKVPYRVGHRRASSTDPGTWASFEAVTDEWRHCPSRTPVQALYFRLAIRFAGLTWMIVLTPKVLLNSGHKESSNGSVIPIWRFPRAVRALKFGRAGRLPRTWPE